MQSHHVRFVDSFDALIATPFSGDVNALCWRRDLPGDFKSILNQLGTDEGITTIDDDDLRALTLNHDGAIARDILLEDQALLRRHGLAPILDCINGYTRDALPNTIPTDVYSFHVDSAPVPADTYLCTYIGASSEGLANADAIRRIDDPDTRGRLLSAHGGADDDGFAEYLRERCYDLHYVPRAGAETYAFGVGNLWRVAIAHPGCPVLPCIHRAPLTLPGSPARLLLIS